MVELYGLLLNVNGGHAGMADQDSKSLESRFTKVPFPRM